MKVKGITLGCKVNTYETEYILSSFKKKGYQIVEDDVSDIYIINTCSVTNTSDAKSRKVINKIIRENKNAVIVVMGCMIESHKDYDNENVSIIIGNCGKTKVLELVEEYLKNHVKKKLLYDNFDSSFEDMFIDSMQTRTRGFIKIEDGCENFCSYCIIPYTRGRVRSKDKDKVIEEINTLVRNGYKEIVLTGIHTGHYGSDIGTKFSSLLKEIVKIDGLERLRISSIEITELDDEFLELLKNNKIIVPHMHIPLQSGSDSILKLMNRKYLTKYFYDKIKLIRSVRPDISITTDVIVGFPGETDELFLETLDFCKKIEFSKIHVFPYSVREGTVAATMKNQVDEETKKDRVQKLVRLSNLLEARYLDSFINKDLDVLVETNKNGYSIGHTGNYLKVRVQGVYESNKIIKVKIDNRDNLTLEGSVLEYERV